MPEAMRWEAERSAWIKSRKWLDKPGAARRAEQLARRARKLDRAKTGLGETAMHESETKGTFYRWTHHDDSKTSALGFMAFVTVFAIVGPIYFGLTWMVGQATYKALESAADKHRVLIWPYFVAAVAAAVFFWIGRPLGFDLRLIYGLAWLIETVTGGWVGPAVLSRWYAAGWISWLEIQVVLGFALGGWKAYAWGWAAPAVRRGQQDGSRGTKAKADPGVRIISSQSAAKSSKQAETPSNTPQNNDTQTIKSDPLKIISGAGGKNND